MNGSYRATYWENGSLALATLVLGVMAGFFWTYSINVNLALAQVSGETYAMVQSLLNQNVRHAGFFVFFFGGGFFAVLAIIANLRQRRGLPFWLLVGAALLYVLGIILYTKQVNLPLNYYTESWNPSQLPEDWAAVRAQWNAANDLRVMTSMAAFGLSLLALTLRACRLPAEARLSGDDPAHAGQPAG